MDEITIHYHLAIPTIGCLGLLVFFFFRRKSLYSSRFSLLWISATVFVAAYLFIVGSSLITDIQYQVDVNRYDLNKDGMFSGEEITPESREAMFKLSNDVGRNFSIFTGAIFAGIISIATYILGKIIQIILTQKLSEPS